MSRQPASRREANSRTRETVFTNVGMGPSGVIDFIQPLSAVPGQEASHLVAADDQPVDPYAVRGGPPAYLEAHGVRYVPEAVSASGAAMDAEARPELVSMARPYDEPQEELNISAEDLNSRVDDRIRHFMQRTRGATKSANERLEELHANMQSQAKRGAPRQDWSKRLEAVQSGMETQARTRMAAPAQRANPVDYDW